MFNSALKRLIESLSELPSIGEKTAERIAFYLVKQGKEKQNELSYILESLQSNIHYCSICRNFSDDDVCPLCTDGHRNKDQICIVESPIDVLSIEKTQAYSGTYLVLHGVLSPMGGITPQKLQLEKIPHILEKRQVSELIFALSGTLEGEATIHYIQNLLPKSIKITRLARGLPSGASLEYADEITLTQALRERH